MAQAKQFRLSWVVTVSFFFLTHCILDAARWRDVTPEEFALKKPVVDPEYGAEILFSEATLVQELTEYGTTGSFRYYNRIKVFNEKGVEDLSKFELTYLEGAEILRLEGRTVKPDGTVIKLEKDNIFDQEVIRTSRRKMRATSFAFPNLEPGDIIELQYRQRTGDSAFLLQIPFLSTLPAQRVYRKITPFTEEGIGNKIIWFKMPDFDGKPKRRGTWEFELFNLPAKTEEPYALPDLHLGPFVVLYYYNSEPKNKTYWVERSRELYKKGRRGMKPSKQIEDFVKAHTKGAKSVTDALTKLYLYCQAEINNHDYSHGVYTEKELEDLPKNDTPQETYSRGHGTPENINALFGSMARALGLKAELASTNDIRFMLFNEGSQYFFALRDDCAAIEIDGEWKFFNPGSPFLPFDSIAWWACGSKALIGRSKRGELTLVPMPKAEFSTRTRTGNFTIDKNGNLTGRVSIEYSGFKDLDMKEDLSSKHTDEEEQDWIIHELKENLPQVQAGDFSIRNRSSRNPLRISYDLNIPEYADVTGKRIFLQPAIFQKSAEPVFTAEKRHGDILFPYPWTEKDDISIQIPEGFSLEEGSAPQPIDLGALGNYEARLGITSKNVVKYRRTFSINLWNIKKKFYGTCKNVFSVVNHLDQHALTFKREET